MNAHNNSQPTDPRVWWSLAGSILAWIGYRFLLLPSWISSPISFGGGQELTFPPKSFSRDLFKQFFNDPGWWGTAVQSTIGAVVTTLLALLVGLPATYAFARSRFRGSKLLELLTLSP